MLPTHNEYPKLKLQLLSHARQRALSAGIDAEEIGRGSVRLQFDNPVWNGTYHAPVWANVDIDLDGGRVYRVTHDWEHGTLKEGCE